MPRSASDSTTSSPSVTHKSFFPQVSNPFSSNGKPEPQVDTNPPSVVRSFHNRRRETFSAIGARSQSAGTLFRRLSNFTGQDKPHRGGFSLKSGRRPSIAQSQSTQAAVPNLSIPPILPTSDATFHVSPTESYATTTPFQDVPTDFHAGVTITKVSAKGTKKVIVKVDPDLGQILYQSRRARTSECPPC